MSPRKTVSRGPLGPATGPPAGFLPLQHPKLVATPPAGPGWVHEVKFDGYRMQVRVERGTVAIYSRNGAPWTARLPELAEAAAALPDAVLDGELCVLDSQGRSDFSALRASLSPGRTGRLVYLPFDQLWGEGEDLRARPLAERKAVLARTMAGRLGGVFQAVAPLPQGGPDMLAAACRLGLEGVVSKRLDSRYVARKADSWVKAKCRPGQEVVVGGWMQAPDGGPFKSLLVGVYDDDGRFVYAGSVKVGFSARAVLSLVGLLRALEVVRTPFDIAAPRKTREIHWAEPRLVANVEIAEWTASGKLRQASFKGLREDKDPRSVRREGSVSVSISN